MNQQEFEVSKSFYLTKEQAEMFNTQMSANGIELIFCGKKSSRPKQVHQYNKGVQLKKNNIKVEEKKKYTSRKNSSSSQFLIQKKRSQSVESEFDENFDHLTQSNTQRNAKMKYQKSDKTSSLLKLAHYMGRQSCSHYFFNPNFPRNPIQQNIDLSIITERCESSYYLDPMQFKQDVEKMFELCYQHFSRSSEAYMKTIEMNKLFINQYSNLEQSFAQQKIFRLNRNQKYFSSEPKKVTKKITKRQSQTSSSKRSVQWTNEGVTQITYDAELSVDSPPQSTQQDNLKQPHFTYEENYDSAFESEDISKEYDNQLLQQQQQQIQYSPDQLHVVQMESDNFQIPLEQNNQSFDKCLQDETVQTMLAKGCQKQTADNINQYQDHSLQSSEMDDSTIEHHDF